MTDTTVTVTEPLKEHLKNVKSSRGETSLNDVIQSIIENPVNGQTTEVPEGDMEENPAPIKISEYTHVWLKQVKENSEHEVFEDLLRELSGASGRDHGEQPIEWEPL
jgi:predicted CopG family antitoxin